MARAWLDSTCFVRSVRLRGTLPSGIWTVTVSCTVSCATFGPLNTTVWWVGWVKNNAESDPVLFTDADFAGCHESMRSTNGVHFEVAGPETKFPTSGVSNMQTATSWSTPEAELVAGAFGLHTEGIPAVSLMNVITQRQSQLQFREDNQAMIRVCETGKNPQCAT